MTASVGDLVIPGDTLGEAKEQEADNKKIFLGDGLRFVINF